MRLVKLVQRVLLDRQRVQRDAEPVGLALPLVQVGELRGEVRLPEGDVADAADAEDRHQLGARALQVGDLLGVGRQVRLAWRSCAASAGR